MHKLKGHHLSLKTWTLLFVFAVILGTVSSVISYNIGKNKIAKILIADINSHQKTIQSIQLENSDLYDYINELESKIDIQIQSLSELKDEIERLQKTSLIIDNEITTEKITRDKLDCIEPNEHVYVDISGN